MILRAVCADAFAACKINGYSEAAFIKPLPATIQLPALGRRISEKRQSKGCTFLNDEWHQKWNRCATGSRDLEERMRRNIATAMQHHRRLLRTRKCSGLVLSLGLFASRPGS
jgi:hypothetical protein